MSPRRRLERGNKRDVSLGEVYARPGDVHLYLHLIYDFVKRRTEISCDKLGVIMNLSRETYWYCLHAATPCAEIHFSDRAGIENQSISIRRVTQIMHAVDGIAARNALYHLFDS